jgi:xanthine dehydrogenase YagR molybdenum-binding subunit
MLGQPEAHESQFRLEEGAIVYGPDPEQRVPFSDVVAKMDGYTIVGKGGRGPNPEGKRVNTFGAQFAVVDVNVETGEVRVQNLVAVHEVGRIINPLTATNQVYGGITQGLGFGTMEERVIDPGSGLQLTDNLESYKIPTIMDQAPMDVAFVDLVDAEANSLGAKGLGEPPIIPTAAALLNAVSDALDLRLTDLPLTPRRVLDALHRATAEVRETEGGRP